MKKSADFPHKVNCRISSKGYENLVRLLNQTKAESMSSLVRNILENRKIQVSHREKSLDMFMETFLSLDTESQKIVEKLSEPIQQLYDTGSVAVKLYLAGKIDSTLRKLSEEQTRIEELILPIAKEWVQK